jgi:hypothetical protein
MTILRAQVALQGKLGLPKQQFMNTLHFDVPGIDPAGEAALIDPVLQAFYKDGANGNQVAQNDHPIRYYDLDDPEPRVPVLETLMDLPAAPNVEGYPSEVALACSYSGAVISGANMARRRGRFYFGPLKNTSGDLVGNVIRPVDNLVACLVANMEALEADIDALGAGFRWVVYSPTSNSSTPVTNGWVDNAFDTQRRRGEDATARVTWGA